MPNSADIIDYAFLIASEDWPRMNDMQSPLYQQYLAKAHAAIAAKGGDVNRITMHINRRPDLHNSVQFYFEAPRGRV